METPANLIEMLFERIEAYGKTILELLKFKVLEAVSNLITKLVSRLIILIMVVLCVSFFSIGIALYIGELLEKLYYGFFIVAAFYFVLGTILFFSLHKWIKEPIDDLMITALDTEGV